MSLTCLKDTEVFIPQLLLDLSEVPLSVSESCSSTLKVKAFKLLIDVERINY